MVPLTLGGPAGAVWRTSCTLERIPGLNVVATSLDIGDADAGIGMVTRIAEAHRPA